MRRAKSICCLLICFLLAVPFAAWSETPEVPVIRADLVSYDYSRDAGPDGQTRIWARIRVQTPVEPGWNHPGQYTRGMAVKNVRIIRPVVEGCSSNKDLFPAVNAVPVDTDPDTVINSYDGWDEYWKRLFPDWKTSSPYSPDEYWSTGFKPGETEWILEILLPGSGRTEDDIRKFIDSLFMVCDIDAEYCEQSRQDLPIESGHAVRETRFDETGLQFRADSFSVNDAFYADREEKAAVVSACLGDTAADPDQYSVIDIGISMLKQMPWAVFSAEAGIVPSSSVICVLPDEYNRNQWKNGFFPVVPVSLLMKTGDMDEQEIRESLKDLELYLDFSTEYAGDNCFDGPAGTGHPGIRHTLRVDMQEILTMDEMMKKIGNISDG